MLPPALLRRVVALSFLLLAAGLVFAQPAPKLSPDDQARYERDVAYHALNRCAFGARPGDFAKIAEKGYGKWIEEQLEPEKIDDSKLEKKIKEKYPALKMTLGEAAEKYWPSYEMMGNNEANEKKRNQLRGQIRSELKESVLTRAVESERQFQEVMVEFWRNHFNVDVNKDDLVYLCPSYEEQVIRQHAFGRFEDMLLASAHHPAMLIYLDNVVSQRPLTPDELTRIDRANARMERGNYTKPRSVVALERHRGLNENYARELLELHTLGADNYYKQWDVTESARVLTGWSVRRNKNNEYGFHFKAEYHDKLPKQILNWNLTGRGGYDDGVSLLRSLAAHPGTSQYISWKLVKYLVNDEPPISLVNKAAARFRSSGGDLRKVYREILLSPEFADRANFKAKFKTPFEFVVSSVRATGAEVSNWDRTEESLKRMGQPIYECEDPTGYYDQAESWCDPGVLVHRWSYAIRLANNSVDGVKMPESFFDSLGKTEGKAAKEKLVRMILPLGIDTRTSEVLDKAAEEHGRERLLGLLLGSPAFQQQ